MSLLLHISSIFMRNDSPLPLCQHPPILNYTPSTFPSIPPHPFLSSWQHHPPPPPPPHPTPPPTPPPPPPPPPTPPHPPPPPPTPTPTPPPTPHPETRLPLGGGEQNNQKWVQTCVGGCLLTVDCIVYSDIFNTLVTLSPQYSFYCDYRNTRMPTLHCVTMGCFGAREWKTPNYETKKVWLYSVR